MQSLSSSFFSQKSGTHTDWNGWKCLYKFNITKVIQISRQYYLGVMLTKFLTLLHTGGVKACRQVNTSPQLKWTNNQMKALFYATTVFLKLLNVRSCQILKQKGENLWPYYQHLIVHLITDGCDIIVQYPRSELFLNILMTRKLMHFRTQLNIFACSTVVWGFPVWIRQLAIVSLTKLNPALNNYSLICQIVNTAFVLHFWIQKRRTRHISLNFARIKKCQKTRSL